MWTTPAYDPATNTIFVSTGTLNDHTQTQSQAIVALNATTLSYPKLVAASVRGGQVALAIVNLGDRPGRSFFSWARLRARPRPANVTDVWPGRDLPVRHGLAVRLPAHGTGVYLLS